MTRKGIKRSRVRTPRLVPDQFLLQSVNAQYDAAFAKPAPMPSFMDRFAAWVRSTGARLMHFRRVPGGK